MADANRAEAARAGHRETDGAGLLDEDEDGDLDSGGGEDEGASDADADAADGTGGGAVAGIRIDDSGDEAGDSVGGGGATRSAQRWMKPVCFAGGLLSSALPIHVLLGGALDTNGRVQPNV